MNCGAGTMDKKRHLEYYKKEINVTRREELVKTIVPGTGGVKAALLTMIRIAVDLAGQSCQFLYQGNFCSAKPTLPDRSMLQLIDEALQRMKIGSYGTCIECEEELQQKRLEAVPWARYCVTCAEKHEQGLL